MALESLHHVKPWHAHQLEKNEYNISICTLAFRYQMHIVIELNHLIPEYLINTIWKWENTSTAVSQL